VQKKTGTAGSIVSPSLPTRATEADVADPGQVEEAKAAQKASSTGKYGSTPSQPFKSHVAPGEWQAKETSWIEVELFGEDDKPITGELVEITVPDGRVYRSSTDHKGRVRVAGFEMGDCKIAFPSLDEEAWTDA